jgi:hypothetical protein
VKRNVLILALLAAVFAAGNAFGLSKPGVEYKIFQFPANQMPRIDGKTDDWAIVPDSYAVGTDQLIDTNNKGVKVDPKDLDISVKVGWVKGLNRLYFLYEATDDYWDMRFSPTGYLNDIFEIAVDGDLSGGQFITNNQIKDPVENQISFSGVHAQNYHIYTPPINNDWCLVWGCQPWIKYMPYANYAYSYDVKQGERGKLILELWITPFDYAPHDGPAGAVESKLSENSLIGLGWSVLDFDGGEKIENFCCLSDTSRMVSDASYLLAFRLMPLEKQFLKPIEAKWSYKVIETAERTVAFIDESIGNITGWKWDFGDGSTSTEQNPIHVYEKPARVYRSSVRTPALYTVVTLEVTGPAGTSKTSKFWDVQVK